ncbi:hypothetical protein EDD17DRAFT_1568448 [Pisolithus thermaeus]|nr:hypothetical protein EV401DRAFT_549279 [Pisolithus croceorrhizus]KAI6163569.1 hypothetical protein EDD17DRAFT_1568448 [Pisolithus thermaeus]
MAARSQPEQSRLLIGKSPSSAPNVSPLQGHSQASSGSIASDVEQSGHDSKSWKPGTVVSLLVPFYRGQSSSSAAPVANTSAQEHPQPLVTVQNEDAQGPIGQGERDPVQDMAGGDIDTTRQALEPVAPTPCIGEVAVNVVARANTTVIGLRDMIDTYIKPLQLFNSLVTTIANVHPCVQVALGTPAAASQVWLVVIYQLFALVHSSCHLLIAQADLDDAVLQLFEKVSSVYAFFQRRRRSRS